MNIRVTPHARPSQASVCLAPALLKGPTRGSKQPRAPTGPHGAWTLIAAQEHSRTPTRCPRTPNARIHSTDETQP